jgi:hypothetical protein
VSTLIIDIATLDLGSGDINCWLSPDRRSILHPQPGTTGGLLRLYVDVPPRDIRARLSSSPLVFRDISINCQYAMQDARSLLPECPAPAWSLRIEQDLYIPAFRLICDTDLVRYYRQVPHVTVVFTLHPTTLQLFLLGIATSPALDDLSLSGGDPSRRLEQLTLDIGLSSQMSVALDLMLDDRASGSAVASDASLAPASISLPHAIASALLKIGGPEVDYAVRTRLRASESRSGADKFKRMIHDRIVELGGRVVDESV